MSNLTLWHLVIEANSDITRQSLSKKDDIEEKNSISYCYVDCYALQRC